MNDSRPVSAVVVSYNSASTVIATLDSLLQQSQIPSEIVFVDDCSTDSTFRDVSQWGKYHGDVDLIIIRNEENLGPATSRNIGVKACSSSSVIFCDADDVMLTDRFLKQGKALETVSISYVSSSKHYPNNYEIYHFNSKFSGILPFELAVRMFILGEKSDWQLYVPSCTLGVRKEDFLQIGGFDERFDRLEDVDFALRASKAGLTFQFDDEINVRRSATFGAYKSRNIEAIAQERLLERYSDFLSRAQYREIAAWLRVRKNYFARKPLALTLSICEYLLKSTSPLKRMRAGFARLSHDQKIREK